LQKWGLLAGLSPLLFCGATLGQAPLHRVEPGLTGPALDRVVDGLMRRMTVEEEVLQLLSYPPNGVPRLGIPNLRWGEVLHGVVADGATSFPQGIRS
jgi:beta-glucosidase